MISTVIPAAGTGTRFSSAGQSLPKQYQQLDGEPVYLWSLTAFCAHARIERIVLVVSTDMLCTAKENIANLVIPGKEKISVIVGGATRQQSVKNGIEWLAAETTENKVQSSSNNQSEESETTLLPQGNDEDKDYVIIHDAARPFVTSSMIDATIKSVTEFGACTLGIPLTDTIKRVSDGVIRETLDRSSLYLIQTPQAGRLDWLLSAHRKAEQEKFETTDDAAILEYAGHPVSIVFGSRYNLKITNPEDLSISQALAPIFLNQERMGASVNLDALRESARVR